MSERDRLAFDLELQVNCDAWPLDGMPEDVWLNPTCVEPLTHSSHNVHEILGIAAGFDRNIKCTLANHNPR